MPHRARHLSPPFKRGHQASPMHHWEHPLLHMSRGPHRPHGPQHNCKQTSQRDQINDEKMHSAPRLPCHPSQRDSTISCFQHDPQQSLQHILPLRSQCSQLCVWPFFHGLATGHIKTNKFDRGVFHPMCDFTFCRRLRSEGQTRCPLPQLQTGHYLLTYTRRNGPPSAPHPHQL
jgi:hypothetical protein